MIKRIVATAGVLAVALAFSGWQPALAQGDGLTEEQLALLDRVFAASEQLQAFESYIEEGAGDESQELTVTLEEQAFELLDSTEWQRTQTVINAPEGKNVDAQLSATVSSQGEETFRINAEARFVAGTLYVSAAYDEPAAELAPLPEGWIAVEDADTIGETYPALDALQLGSIASDEPSALLEDQERIRTTATDVTLETITLEDGTSADQITVVIGRDALLEIILEDTDDSFQLGLFSALSEDSQATLSVVLDDEGRAVEVRNTIELSAQDIDAAALSPDDFPPGALLSFSFVGNEEQRFRQIGETFEPVSAPEELAPTPAS